MLNFCECLQVTGPVNAQLGEMEEVVGVDIVAVAAEMPAVVVVGAGRGLLVGTLIVVELFHSHHSALVACAVSIMAVTALGMVRPLPHGTPLTPTQAYM